MSGATATSAQEEPVFFRVGDNDLFGILTRPTVEPNGITAILLSGAGKRGIGGIPSPGRNRIWVKLARSLAAEGFHSLRMDLAGIGESSGFQQRYLLSKPNTEDVLGAIDWLAEQGLTEIALVGTCFGGRSALAAGAASPNVIGVAAFTTPFRDANWSDRQAIPPVRFYLRRLVRPDTARGFFDPLRRKYYAKAARRIVKRVGATLPGRRGVEDGGTQHHHVTGQVKLLVERNVPLLLGFGDEDQQLVEFRNATAGPLKDVLTQAGTSAELVVTKGHMHGLASIPVQDDITRLSTEWLCTLAAARPSTAEVSVSGR